MYYYNADYKVNAAKNLAFKMGQRGISFHEFISKTKANCDNDIGGKTGIFVEVILAWMCGVFQRFDPDFDVEMSLKLDHYSKADFLVKRRIKGVWRKQKVQVKFDNEGMFHLPKDVVLVRLYPLDKFKGSRFCKEIMTGKDAFTDFLIATGLYTYDDVCDLCLENNPEICETFDAVWESITD